MSNWQLETARLTVFVTPEFVAPASLWRDCVGDDPETSTKQKQIATTIEIGGLGEGRLTLQIQPMRVDWVYEAPGIGSENGLPPVLGPFPAATEPLLQLGRKWVGTDKFPETPRIALGLVLLSATHDRMTGYEELAGFVEGVPKEPTATDFSYQVNLPRDSRAGIVGLAINRVSKWSVGMYKLVAVTAGALNQVVAPEYVSLRLELDINTQPSFSGPIPHDRIPRLLEDLCDGAKEICRDGVKRRDE